MLNKKGFLMIESIFLFMIAVMITFLLSIITCANIKINSYDCSNLYLEKYFREIYK